LLVRAFFIGELVGGILGVVFIYACANAEIFYFPFLEHANWIEKLSFKCHGHFAVIICLICSFVGGILSLAIAAMNAPQEVRNTKIQC
jgi:ABC-type lipoprotein release transport system permease subunit